MSEVRPLAAADIPAVAALFQRVFRDPAKPPPAELAAYLDRHYLTAPGCDPRVAPLVHVGAAGTVTGFIGVNALPMVFGERRLVAAICGSLMVDPRAEDAMAAPRLLKSFLAGPQDLSFSETASEVSAQMWTKLRGVALPDYSLDWGRLIRPASFLLDVAASRLGAARLLAPLARGVDRVARRRMQPGELRWSGVADGGELKGGLVVRPLDAAGFAALIAPLTQHFAIRPAWDAAQRDHVLAEAAHKPEFGEPIFAAVETARGAAVGAFLYHHRPGAIARVLQVLARPGQAEAVLDALIRDATERGAAGLRGRTQPALLAAMLGRRIAFTHVASSVVHARDPEILAAFREGAAFVNGLAGEQWSRLVGGRFD
ncbi:hypothetical protein ABE438_10665 [Bosea sp. TWI1241]|uniref:hypothetical protein n=1 Tax=Bosea sp. TWI1241 TaxID=3148904 RepID=UPI00320820EB